MKKLKCCICFLSLIACAQVAYADAGLPMLIVIMPGMIILLVPIILFEAIVLAKYLQIRYKSAIFSAGISNIISTIVGIPITWGMLVGVELITAGGRGYDDTFWGNLISVTLQAPWIAPTEGPQFYWISIAAIGFLMIPFFFMSWWIEGFFVKKMLVQILKPKAYRASFYANLASYAFLEFCIFVYLIKIIFQYNL